MQHDYKLTAIVFRGGGARQSKIVADTMVSAFCEPRFFFDSLPVAPKKASSVVGSFRILFDAMVAILCLMRSMIQRLIFVQLIFASIEVCELAKRNLFLKTALEKLIIVQVRLPVNIHS
jgi:hypothetical protein